MLVISWLGISMTASEEGCSMDFQKNSKKGNPLVLLGVPPRFGFDIQNGDVKWREKNRTKSADVSDSHL
jgi:hypothetical protein